MEKKLHVKTPVQKENTVAESAENSPKAKKRSWSARFDIIRSRLNKWKIMFGVSTGFSVLIIGTLVTLMATKATCFSPNVILGNSYYDYIWIGIVFSTLCYYIAKERINYSEIFQDALSVTSWLCTLLTNSRLKLVLFIVSVIMISGSFYVQADTCLEVPLTNSTISTDKRTLYSVGFKATLDSTKKLCMVTGKGSAYDVSITHWANKFSLDCYDSDDPLAMEDKQRLNNDIVFEDRSLCDCSLIFHNVPICDSSKCKGNYICNVFSHDSKTCKYVYTGMGNYAKKEVCYKGFRRYKICKIEQDDDFELTYKVKLANETYLYTHTGSYSVVGSLDKVQIRTTVDYDDSFEGKYIVLDNNAMDKMWLLPASLVNDKDSRDIRKLGWFRPDDSEDRLGVVEEQLTVRITDCSSNNMTIYEKPLEISDFLAKNAFYEFRSSNSYGVVRDSNGRNYYSDSAQSSMLDNFAIIKVGFMHKVGSQILYVGISGNWSLIGATDVGGLNVGSLNLPQTAICTSGRVIPFGTVVPIGASRVNEWTLADGDKAQVIQLWTGPDTCYYMQLKSADRSTILTSKTITFWPNNIPYKCISTSDTWYSCAPDDTKVGSYTFFSYGDKSMLDFHLQSTYSINVEELVYPTVSAIEVSCKDLVCFISVKSDTPVLIDSDDCFNDIIVGNVTKTLAAYSACDKIVAFSARYQGKTLLTKLFSVNCTRTTEIEVKMQYNDVSLYEKVSDFFKKTFDYDFGPFLTWLKYYWLPTSIIGGGLVIVITIIALILIFSPEILCCCCVNNLKKKVKTK